MFNLPSLANRTSDGLPLHAGAGESDARALRTDASAAHARIPGVYPAYGNYVEPGPARLVFHGRAGRDMGSGPHSAAGSGADIVQEPWQASPR